MPKRTTQHWTDSLFDSVYALYETAHEYQTAHRAAQVAEQMVGMDRRQLHPGRIALEGRVNAYGRTLTREPHEKAIYDLGSVYRQAERQMHRQYEEAAILYASGAAWAIRSVQRDDTPPVVAFQTDEDGDIVPNLMEIPGLDTYHGGPALDAAYAALVRCAGASEHAEDLASRDYVSDHEAGEMFSAGEVAEGLADAAFAYGLLAQRALNYVLIEPRRARERELAVARAAAQAAQPSN
ncbi:hypothetical protein E6R60_05750 [Streptomyces sp. A0642]|uniref:hypothetical protein n=1 Tax=Streptomyces sp. A0642 TaxID=2563100 RepID=UPI0010A29BA1|nr:hypothetical protein [Streptomyces sp. A0642]THA78389.1 hypothetical protein E6R60_05750 [Streptomyces sp. A0642]